MDGGPPALPFPPEEGVELLWSIPGVALHHWGPPVLAASGDIYAGRTRYPPQEGSSQPDSLDPLEAWLVRLSSDGEIVQSVLAPTDENSHPPVIRPDGSLLTSSSAADWSFGTFCGPVTIRAWSPDLVHQWTWTDESPLRGNIAVRSDNVVMARVGARLVAVSPDGALLWSRTLGDLETCSWDGSPDDGTVIVGPGDVSYTHGQGSKITAFSAQGEELWTVIIHSYGFDKRLVPADGGVIFIPGDPMSVVSLAGELVNEIPKVSDHWRGLSGEGAMAITTATGHPRGFSTSAKVWSAPFGYTADSSIGFRTTKGLILAFAWGMSSKASLYTYPTLRVYDAKTGDVVGQHFGAADGSFALDIFGGVLRDDGAVIGRGGISGDLGLYAIRLPYGGLAKTGWPVIFGDNQHSNRFALAEPPASP